MIEKTAIPPRSTQLGIPQATPRTSAIGRAGPPPKAPAATSFRISLIAALQNQSQQLEALVETLRHGAVYASTSEDAIDYDLCRRFAQRSADALGAALITMNPPIR